MTNTVERKFLLSAPKFPHSPKGSASGIFDVQAIPSTNVRIHVRRTSVKQQASIKQRSWLLTVFVTLRDVDVVTDIIFIIYLFTIAADQFDTTVLVVGVLFVVVLVLSLWHSFFYKYPGKNSWLQVPICTYFIIWRSVDLHAVHMDLRRHSDVRIFIEDIPSIILVIIFLLTGAEESNDLISFVSLLFSCLFVVYKMFSFYSRRKRHRIQAQKIGATLPLKLRNTLQSDKVITRMMKHSKSQQYKTVKLLLLGKDNSYCHLCSTV